MIYRRNTPTENLSGLIFAFCISNFAYPQGRSLNIRGRTQFAPTVCQVISPLRTSRLYGWLFSYALNVSFKYASPSSVFHVKVLSSSTM